MQPLERTDDSSDGGVETWAQWKEETSSSNKKPPEGAAQSLLAISHDLSAIFKMSSSCPVVVSPPVTTRGVALLVCRL